MLKERVTITTNGFQVIRDPENSDRKAYYTTFTLADAEIKKIPASPIHYWDAMNANEQKIENKTYVHMWEMDQNQIVEEYNHYFGIGDAKSRIEWKIERNKRYGEFAYMITLEWVNNVKDVIHKNHIWLYHKKSGRKFSFLSEQIKPRKSDNRKDQYIINLPHNIKVTDLNIEGDELLQKKVLLIGVGR